METLRFDTLIPPPPRRRTQFFPRSDGFQSSTLSSFAGPNNQSQAHLAGLLCQTRASKPGSKPSFFFFLFLPQRVTQGLLSYCRARRAHSPRLALDALRKSGI